MKMNNIPYGYGTTSEFSRVTNTEYLLMYRDTTVLSFTKDMNNLVVINKQYLPYGLRNSVDSLNLRNWLCNRTTPLTRSNAECLYKICGEPQTPEGQLNIALYYGSASINDSFWIKEKEAITDWNEIKGTTNINMAFGLFMLTGDKVLATNLPKYSPEATLQGNWSKCIVDTKDGLLLYKADDSGVAGEVYRFGRLLDIPVVEHWQEEYKGVPCSVCRIISDEDHQWISAREFGVEKAIDMFTLQYYRMKTFDYIVGNTSRQSLSWSVEVNEGLNPIRLTRMYNFSLAHDLTPMNPPEQIHLPLLRTAEVLASRTSRLVIPSVDFYKHKIKLLSEEALRRDKNYKICGKTLL